MTEQDFTKLLVNSQYSRKATRIRLEIDITDAQGTYGYKTVINGSVLERVRVCEHCRERYSEAPRFCEALDPEGGIHNWKSVFVPIATATGDTPEAALVKLLCD